MTDISINIHGAEGVKSATKLPASLFGQAVNLPLIHQVVVAQQAAARQGTHSTKTRGEVRGGGIKPWRQKGTGRARQGSRRAPQWAGGGTVFGPQPRSYAQRTPKKMIAAALASALSERLADQQLFVIDALVFGDLPSTSKALKALSVIGEYKTALVVLDRDEDLAWLSLRNVPYIHAIAVDQLNTYDVVVNQKVVFTKAALDQFVARQGFDLTEESVESVSSAKAEKPAKTAKAAPAKAASAKASATSTEAAQATSAVESVDYGPDSYRGSKPPAGFDIKGNEDSMLYHTPESTWYKQTIAEVWFNSAEAAEAAGFTDAMKGKK
ncbi:MAG: 50S ribosomal protein L4 [Propionibacteriaceae bacterium]|jgi:large subunit ribosomal protein L4|nr:50S ribosomal protein L4 [Propionibacteriaceae bacterium]